MTFSRFGIFFFFYFVFFFPVWGRSVSHFPGRGVGLLTSRTRRLAYPWRFARQGEIGELAVLSRSLAQLQPAVLSLSGLLFVSHRDPTQVDVPVDLPF